MTDQTIRTAVLGYLPDGDIYGVIPASELVSYADSAGLTIQWDKPNAGRLLRDGIPIRSFVLVDRIRHHLP